MPLYELTEYFNQRFTGEYRLKESPLEFRDGKVEGRFRDLRFGTRLTPIRRGAMPALSVGHDACSWILSPEGDSAASGKGLVDDLESEQLVNLDRLSRTVHMLNYLPRSHDEGFLFLPVHPRHVLFVQRDHGAYFEDILQRCGLPTRRVVMSLPVSPAYDRQMPILLERLRGHRDRGYATAVQFDARVGEDFPEQHCIGFLRRFTPDFVRFHSRFLLPSGRNVDGVQRLSTLLAAIRRLDTKLLIGAVQDDTAAKHAEDVRADCVQGEYYEQSALPWLPALATAVGQDEPEGADHRLVMHR